jgi:hypothetical protein
MQEQRQPIWPKAALHGALLATAVAAAVTFYDWWLNPSGVFHDAAGTNWPAVGETFFSWWLPLLPAGWAIAAGFHFLRRHLSRSR